MLRGVLLDIPVRRFEAPKQSFLLSNAKGMLIHLSYRLHGEPTGLLPALIPAHSVRNDRQASLAHEFLVRVRLPIKIRILIVGPLAADVGQTGGFDSRLWFFTLDCHILLRSSKRGSALIAPTLVTENNGNFNLPANNPLPSGNGPGLGNYTERAISCLPSGTLSAISFA